MSGQRVTVERVGEGILVTVGEAGATISFTSIESALLVATAIIRVASFGRDTLDDAESELLP